MSQPPSTPVKVPPSASSYTPATLDPDLRSQINTLLIKDGHINKIQDSLLHSLNSNTTNWPTLVQAHALSLLRSGEVSTYPALLARVLDDIRSDSLASGGAKPTNGDSARSSNGNSNTATSDKTSLAVPESVIEDALRTTRESLEALCEVEDDGSS
ncbi:hypothetical protein V2G26_020888 [Clonostachys chloroleuca]|uniref:Uncharacterized protein n=1 Tax=Clonostachys chloroleuca TaxID=1926264 RepID=A0AA35Q1G6_9HYPO|nr:unnamed protein product [Clonostachys chloroleuca]